jgi:predicted outer membrane protein
VSPHGELGRGRGGPRDVGLHIQRCRQRRARDADRRGRRPRATIELIAHNRHSASVRATPAAGSSSPDTSFYRTLAEGGMAEVDLGKLAEQKSTDPKVQEFAAMMVKDHSAANEKLESLASSNRIPLPDTLDASHEETKTRLEALSGDGFNKSYIETQVGAPDRQASSGGRAYARQRGGRQEREPLGLAVEQPAQLHLGALEDVTALRRETPSGAVDVKIEHRHRRAERLGLAPPTLERRSFQGCGDGAGRTPREHARLEIERIARLHDLGGPTTRIGLARGTYAPAGLAFHAAQPCARYASAKAATGFRHVPLDPT